MYWGNFSMEGRDNNNKTPENTWTLTSFPSFPCYSIPNMGYFPNYGHPIQHVAPSFSSPSLTQQVPLERIFQNPQSSPALEPRADLQPQNRERKKIIFCQCNKSKCLKEYCLCFKHGKACGESCKCEGCKNIRFPEANKRASLKKTPITCNCVKSKCQKKYCECFAAGKKCGAGCKCSECMN